MGELLSLHVIALAVRLAIIPVLAIRLFLGNLLNFIHDFFDVILYFRVAKVLFYTIAPLAACGNEIPTASIANRPIVEYFHLFFPNPIMVFET